MQKKALLLCASHNDLGLIRALRKMGFYIIATGNRENLIGQKWIDKFIKADYSDEKLILQIAKAEQIDNIVACCNDYGVYTAAYVAEKMRLPGYDSYETTLILNNKDKFKEFAYKNGILTPIAVSFTDKESAKSGIADMQLPLIVKPVDCSAGNGISVIELYDQAEKSINYAFEKSRASRIVIEPFLKGTQHGFCTYLFHKKVVAVCTNNEYSMINPYRVEIDTFPATNYEKYQNILIDQIEKIARILDLKDGIFHLQYMICGGKPWILEVMRRTIGNMYHVLGNELNGINWEYWEAKARCGMDCSNFPRTNNQEGYFAYKTILGIQNGTIKDIKIPKEYEKYIFEQIILLHPGDDIVSYKNQPVGLLFMMFSSEEEMINVLIDNYRNDLVIMQ